MVIVLVMIYVLTIKINTSMQILFLLDMLDIVELRLNSIKWVWIEKVRTWVVYLVIAIFGIETNLKVLSDIVKFIMVVGCKFELDIICGFKIMHDQGGFLNQVCVLEMI